MGTLIRELTHASIYKRSQGRITRQVTFAALAIALALGCWRLHEMLRTWNPGFRFGLQEVRATASGYVELKRKEGDARFSEIEILDDAGKVLQKEAIPDYGLLRVQDKAAVKADDLLLDWDNDATILGMVSFGLPALLLAAGVWVSYRLVNVPGFADFLIAVEAEVNKVSWPSRSELIRASTVVLITIFILAVVLAVFDLFWRFIFHYVLKLF